jgi:hypothetical protein
MRRLVNFYLLNHPVVFRGFRGHNDISGHTTLQAGAVLLTPRLPLSHPRTDGAG